MPFFWLFLCLDVKEPKPRWFGENGDPHDYVKLLNVVTCTKFSL